MSNLKSLGASAILVACAFVGCLVASKMERRLESLQAGAVMTFYAAGGILALISGAELLLRVARDAPAPSLIPWMMTLLAGVFLISFHWGAALGLAALGIAILLAPRPN